ncbi:hypothetical protein LCGC14_1776310 [marine sediment metagenome]|uniref:Acyl-CoA dehydrogenase/oxidase C-terminal domain-containing protein n=1 Tax=marine sediment metagenome TaxID=412755 RepID=A0A0F9GWY8_9ZZZZ
MDHELSDAHKLIRDTARPVARERAGPRAAGMDETGEYPPRPVPRLSGGGPARAAIQIEAARRLVYHAASLVDAGKYERQDAPYLSIAKTFATEMSIRVSSDAIQILGAQGYMKDHPLERHYRDARQLTIVEGTSQIQRLVIARAMIQGEINYW